MSVDIYFFIEVQDKDGKWHLVKYYSDGEYFDKDEPTEWDFEKVIEVGGKRMIEKYEMWPGLAWRDELSWSRAWNYSPTVDGLPKDVSDELKNLIIEHGEREKARRKPMYGDDYEYDYMKQYAYIGLDDMYKIQKEKFENWEKRLKEKVRDDQLEDLKKRISHIEKIALGKADKPLKVSKKNEDYCYEDTLEYLLEEDLFDILALKRETNEVYTIASNFSGNRWIDSEKIRVIYYYT